MSGNVLDKGNVDGDKLNQIINEMDSESKLDYPASGGSYIDNYYDFIDIMNKISQNHDDFLKNDTNNISRVFPASFSSNDKEYYDILNAYRETQYIYNQSDQNGGVEQGGSTSNATYGSPGAGSGYSSGSTPEIEGSSYDVGSPTEVPTPSISKSSNLVSPAKAAITGSLSNPSSSKSDFQARVSNPVGNSTKSVLSGTAATAATGAAAGGIAGAAGAVGGSIIDAVSSAKSKIDNPSVLEQTDFLLGNYDCSNIGNELDDDQTKNITELLTDYGCSEEEISAILNGEYSVSQVLVDSVSEELGGLVKNSPAIRQDIIDKYGIDVFNEDGSVNNDKLSLALCIDDLDGKDDYSLINLLSKNYGVNLVDPDKMSSYSKKMEELLLSDFSVKEKIKNEYGFDLYNSDGSVNTDRLTLLMLIDSKRSDGRTIDNLIDTISISSVGHDLASSIKGTNIESLDSNNFNTIKKVGVALTAAGAVAAAGVGAKKVIDKKSKKENETEQNIEKTDDIVDDSNNIDNNDGNSSWIYDVINE